jgi:hypothetical protein
VSKHAILWAALVAGIFAAARLNVVTPAPSPVVVNVDDLSPAMATFKRSLSSVNAEDRAALADYYAGLSRAVESDPQADPVFKTTQQIRTGHRAGLLVLWRGFLGNATNEYAGLREGMEGVLAEAIGNDEVPLNPAIRQKAVAAFRDMAALCTSGKR